jgi:putative nucleotidyltransferase with HDIG domain
MNQLTIYSDAKRDSRDLYSLLEHAFNVQILAIDEIHERAPERYLILDVNLRDVSRLFYLKEWLANKPKDGKAIFVVDKTSHVQIIRANAIGATYIAHRPLDKRELLTGLLGDLSAFCQSSPDFIEQSGPAVSAGLDALQNVFLSTCLGEEPDAKKIEGAGEQIVDQIGDQGLACWIETVRRHHSQTYQHCLLVTGVAVAFGDHLGFSQRDRMRLSLGAILHDIGKAKIPISILEKPAPLDQDELAIIWQHPQLGHDSLASTRNFPSEMLEVILHHHEYLDGSGYPSGLRGNQINDLVRIMTISDVFGALVERRSYKPPLSGRAAYQVLLDMGPKLDQDLVREFGAITHLDRLG